MAPSARLGDPLAIASTPLEMSGATLPTASSVMPATRGRMPVSCAMIETFGLKYITAESMRMSSIIGRNTNVSMSRKGTVAPGPLGFT
eukprot:359126-Chlamydomonas_euryale.AAC.4